MPKSITKNYVYNTSYQILTLITPFITTPYLSRVLGADGIGIYSYTSSVVAYFILIAQFGLATYAQREVAFFRDDKNKRSCIFFETVILQFILMLISLSAYFIFICKNEGNTTIYFIQSLNIIAVFFDITWFFQGVEEFGKIVFRNFVIRLISVAFIFVVITHHDDLTLYILLLGGINILSGIIIWGYLPDYIVKVNYLQLHPLQNMRRIIELFLPQIAVSIYLVMDKTMIGAFTGSPFENGWYEQAEKIAKMPMVVVTSLGTVMLPRIAYYFANRNWKAIGEYMSKSSRFIWFLSIPICFGIIGVVKNFVPWFLGPGYENVIPLAQVISGVVIAISYSNLLGTQYMVPTNRQNMFTFTVVAGAVVNFSLNLVLIPIYQAMGAAVATLGTECVVTLLEAWLLRKELPVVEMFFLSTRYWISGSVMLIVLLVVERMLYPSLVHTVFLICLGLTIYLSVLFFLKDEMLTFVYNKMRTIIHL